MDQEKRHHVSLRRQVGGVRNSRRSNLSVTLAKRDDIYNVLVPLFDL